MQASYFVIPMGFEPMTHALEERCSIQLSYGTFSEYKNNNLISVCKTILQIYASSVPVSAISGSSVDTESSFNAGSGVSPTKVSPMNSNWKLEPLAEGN